MTAMTIKDWLSGASGQLAAANIPSPQLDAQLLLASAMAHERTWLIAHAEEHMRPSQCALANSLLQRRLQREPIAYITGVKEFYGRDFVVTPDVLTPRPETETLIELALQLFQGRTLKQYKSLSKIRLLDVGTGSGAVGITLKLELPELGVTVSDVSKSALAVARKNGAKLGAKPVRYVVSNLLEHWLNHENPKPFDVIVANLPYVDPAWKDTSPELAHEPHTALYATDGGLALIKKLIDQSPSLLTADGYLLLEADPTQHDDIAHYAKTFREVERRDCALLLQKI